jgi:hypothetical protein
MIYRVLFIVFITIFSSCEEKNINVIITGVVKDEVTGEPVPGASVGLQIYFCQDGRCYSSSIPGTGTVSDNDGSYTISYEYNSDKPYLFKDQPFQFPSSYCTYASKSGFVTSDNHYLGDKVYDNADLKLYHSAQLYVHVKNEGIHNLEGARVCIDRGIGFTFFGTPQYSLYCKGRNLDSVFILSNLWGDFTYGCKVVSLNGPANTGPSYFNTDIFLKPDTINNLLIAF